MAKEEIVFENELRKMIYNHITAYPGVSFNTLLKIFEISDGGLRYHLDYLTRCEKIHIKMENGKRCVYPRFDITNIPEHHKLTTVQKQLVEEIRIFPSITRKDLIFRTRFGRSQVSKNLKTLKDLNIVKEIKVDRRTRYQLIPDKELRTKIIKHLIIKLINGEIDEEMFLKLMRSLE